MWKVTRVAEWTGWCSPCGSQERPLVLTRTGPSGLGAWCSGLGEEDCTLLLTCRMCGQWQLVPTWAEDAELVAVPPSLQVAGLRPRAVLSSWAHRFLSGLHAAAAFVLGLVAALRHAVDAPAAVLTTAPSVLATGPLEAASTPGAAHAEVGTSTAHLVSNAATDPVAGPSAAASARVLELPDVVSDAATAGPSGPRTTVRRVVLEVLPSARESVDARQEESSAPMAAMAGVGHASAGAPGSTVEGLSAVASHDGRDAVQAPTAVGAVTVSTPVVAADLDPSTAPVDQQSASGTSHGTSTVTPGVGDLRGEELGAVVDAQLEPDAAALGWHDDQVLDALLAGWTVPVSAAASSSVVSSVVVSPVAEVPVAEVPVADACVVVDPPVAGVTVGDVPVVDAQVASVPVVQACTEDVPVVTAQLVDEPVVQVTDGRDLDARVVELPVVRAHVVRVPAVDARVVDVPVVDVPVVDACAASAPVVVEPQAADALLSDTCSAVTAPRALVLEPEQSAQGADDRLQDALLALWIEDGSVAVNAPPPSQPSTVRMLVRHPAPDLPAPPDRSVVLTGPALTSWSGAGRSTADSTGRSCPWPSSEPARPVDRLPGLAAAQVAGDVAPPSTPAPSRRSAAPAASPNQSATACSRGRSRRSRTALHRSAAGTIAALAGVAPREPATPGGRLPTDGRRGRDLL